MTSPTVESTTPADGSTNIVTSSAIVVDFSEAMDAGSANEGMWSGKNWPAMGAGIYEHYVVLWFGAVPEPQGSIAQCP